NDAQASARSAGSRRSPSNNLDDSNRQSPSPTPRQVKKAKDSPENSSPERSPRHLSRSPSPPTSRRRSRSRDSRSGSDRDQDEDETKRSSSPRRRQIRSGAEDCDEDRINMETIVRALVELDKRRGQSAGPQRSGLHSGTQSMSRIHDIEAENQRLLYNLMRTKNRAKKPNNIDPPVKRPHHSTVNRQKEQRRIEEENRKIFQRLKRIRPTRGMSRDEMISDYKRQASFGLPLSLLGEESNYRQPRITQNPYCQPVSRVHSSTSIVRPGSAAAGGVSASSRPSSAASRASARGSATRTRGGGQRGGGGAGVSSGRPGWPAGW
uniref:Cilia- and flagella-associated protein 97 n=1 Tax=Macrostomum lignano TaxID=282301 RepID=A0A1I8H3H9_9PLAT